MTKVRVVCGKTLMVAFLFSLTAVVNAATVWTGPVIDFSKAAFADPEDPANQDSLSEAASLTRASTRGLYNAAQEPFFQSSGGSPVDTEWAFAGLAGNPDGMISAEDFESLTFSEWATALGGQGNLANNVVGTSGVLHLISDDIYLDIVFTEWGQGGGAGGNFAYSRTSPIPVPAAAWLLGSALGLLGVIRRRRPA
ncbi:MAG: hypothetical protein JSV45_04745 [Chromatiales bacterium]|nr:MAG: hypothetical protein JSV45_04745 [Chromatiales bacterium]